MTVEPGVGGQKFIGRSPEKIRRVRALSSEVEIEVDGGIDARTAPLVVAAGATVLVAGNSVYGYKGGVAAGIKAIGEAFDGGVQEGGGDKGVGVVPDRIADGT